MNTVTVDTRKLVYALSRQRYLLEQMFNERAERLLIGCEDYGRLMEQETPLYRFEFPVKFPVWMGVQGTRMMDMIVTVVPWMEGVLVMPKDNLTEAYKKLENAYARIGHLEREKAALQKQIEETQF